MRKGQHLSVIALACGFFCSCLVVNHCSAQSAGPVGVFEHHGDVGTVLHAGSVDYDATKHTYTVSGSGESKSARTTDAGSDSVVPYSSR